MPTLCCGRKISLARFVPLCLILGSSSLILSALPGINQAAPNDVSSGESGPASKMGQKVTEKKRPKEVNIAEPTELNKALHGGVMPAPPHAMSMPMIAPLFLQSERISSAITMINEVEKSISAQLQVFSSEGVEIASKTIDFGPHTRRSVEISDLLATGSTHAAGWIKLTPDASKLSSMAIAAQLSLTLHNQARDSYFEEEFVMAGMSGSSSMRESFEEEPKLRHLRASTLSKSGSPVVALVNTGAQSRKSLLTCVSGVGAMTTASIELNPNEFRLIRPCSQGAKSVVFPESEKDLGSEAGGTDSQAVGVDISTYDPPGEVLAYGLAMASGGEQDDMLALNFKDSSILKSSEMVFLGVPAGSADSLPSAVFSPEAYLSNFGSSPAHVQIRQSYMVGDTPLTNTVADITVPPYSAKRVKIQAEQGAFDLRNSFVISSDQAPAVVDCNLTSRGGAYGAFQLIGKDKRSENGGGHPWTIENGEDATLLLFNHAQESHVFTVNMWASGKHWQKLYTLAAKETKAININRVISEREKGEDDEILPPTATSGDVSWFTADPVQGVGRLLISSKTTGLARNFSCGYNLVLCGAGFYTYDISFNYFNTGTLGPVYGRLCTAWSPTACYGDSYGRGGGSSYRWTSQNPSIAPVSGPGTSAGGLFFGQLPGTAGGQGQISNQYCQAAQNGTAVVLPVIQISSVTANPTSIFASIPSKNTTTIEVQLYFEGKPTSNDPHTITVGLASYRTTPGGNNITYEGEKSVDFTYLSKSPISVYFTASADAQTATGNVVVSAVARPDNEKVTVKLPAGTPPAAANNTTITTNK